MLKRECREIAVLPANKDHTILEIEMTETF